MGMSEMTLADVSKAMSEIDFAMLSTRAVSGDIAARPMSNNGDVEFKGDSYFFSWEKAHSVADIERDPRVGRRGAGGTHP
jgi:general stress protein 26